MSRFGRREALKLGVAASIAPLFTSQTTFASSMVRSGFDPPDVPMILRRVLIRDLMDGAAITVTRDWAVQFAPFGRGYRLTGRQVSADVSAPDNLAQIAALEQQRVDDGQFPMMIDASGAIMREGAPIPVSAPQAEVENAIAIAVAKITPYDGSGMGRSYLASLANSAHALISDAPRDLFYPQETHWVSRKNIALPGGESGQVAVTFDAALSASGNIMHQARREVVTRIAKSQRVSREEWALETV